MKLITFGDSWVFGIGAEYQKGMSRDEYSKIEFNDSVKSWRGLLSKQHTLKNINFSHGGSSNQMQFRMASEFYIKNNVKKHLSKNAGKFNNDMILFTGLSSSIVILQNTKICSCLQISLAKNLAKFMFKNILMRKKRPQNYIIK